MKNALKILLIVAASLIAGNALRAQYSVMVNTMVNPPVDPYLNKLAESISRILIVNLQYSGNAMARVKLAGKIERLSPSPFSISSNPSYQPSQPIILSPQQPFLQINQQTLVQAFGNFNLNSLVYSNIKIDDFRDGVNYRLPEGVYRICVVAYNYDEPGFTVPISDPNLGCATFRICYSASAPQLLNPVGGIQLGSDFPVVMPAQPLSFSWTQPVTTCGLPIQFVQYDLVIREVLGNQTVNDANNNPPVLNMHNLNSPLFLLDSNLYRNVLVKGKKYAAQVRAVPAQVPGSPLVIENRGYSRPMAFQYDEQAVVAAPPAEPPAAPAPTENMVPVTMTGNCNNAPAITNTTPIAADASLTNTDIRIGKFTLVSSDIQVQENGKYQGTGYVIWKPFETAIRLSVVFNDIRINTDTTIYEGIVNSSMDPELDVFDEFFGEDGIATNILEDPLNIERLRDITDGRNLVNEIRATGIPMQTPLGIRQKIGEGDDSVTVAIMGIQFKPEGAAMGALVNMNTPETNGWLSLAGKDFCINPDNADMGRGVFYLPNDRIIYFIDGEDSTKLVIKGSRGSITGTMLEYSDNKLDSIHVLASIVFADTLLKYEMKSMENSPVTAILNFSMTKWDDWVATAAIPWEFSVKALPGYTFAAEGCAFDHSNTRNPSGFVYPGNHPPPGKTFRGFIAKKIWVRMPEEFAVFRPEEEEEEEPKEETTAEEGGIMEEAEKNRKRIRFEAADLVISENGLISMDISANNVIGIDTGNLGGWAFSLSKIFISIRENTFESAGLEGLLNIPISNTAIKYTGSMFPENNEMKYSFNVHPEEDIELSIFKKFVRANIAPSSGIEIAKDQHGFAIAATLSGSLNINAGGKMKLLGVGFEEMKIGNRKPDGSPGFGGSLGKWALASPQKEVGGFPFSFSDYKPIIGLRGVDTVVFGIGLTGSVVLGEGMPINLSGSAEFELLGLLKLYTNRKPEPAGAEIKMNNINIDGDAGPVKVKGELKFYEDDLTYGNGVRGSVEAVFPLVAVEATAQFGSKKEDDENFYYWYVDASAAFGTPIAIGTTGLGIAGFGGGAYFNMTMNDARLLTPGTASNAGDNAGATRSGLVFTPARGTGDNIRGGLRASVWLSLATTPQVFNSKFTLTAEINGAALAALNLSGEANFMSTSFPNTEDAIVKADASMTINFEKSEFSINANVNASLTEGVDLHIPLQVYANPDKWYVKLGDPMGERMGLKIDVPATEYTKMDFNIEAYLATGVNDAGLRLPPLPEEVREALGDPSERSKADEIIRLVNANAKGGFLFGASIDGTLLASVGPIYVDLRAIAGFDLALLALGEKAKCGGKAMGWNGFYGIGQFYAYLKGDVSVDVSLPFYEGKIVFMRMEAGAKLEGGAPTPAWLTGSLKVKGSVFCGAVVVDQRFDFTVGEACYPPAMRLSDIAVVSDYGPKEVENVSVLELPYVASTIGFSYAGEQNELIVQSQEGVKHFRVVINNFSLQEVNGATVDTRIEYSENNRYVSLSRKDMLKSNRAYKMSFTYAIQQKRGSSWGNPETGAVTKTISHEFTTGEAPKTLDGNIANSYPAVNQRYLLTGEFSGQAFIRLRQWPSNNILLDQPTLGGQGPVIREIRFVPAGGGATITAPFTLQRNALTLSYALPSGLQPSQVYTAEVYAYRNTPVAANGISQNISSASLNTIRRDLYGEGITSVELKATSRPELASVKLLYSFKFGTSRYSGFVPKLESFGNWGTLGRANPSGAEYTKMYIGYLGNPPEPFDELEVKGVDQGAPPMLTFKIPWNNSKANDRYADNEIYNIDRIKTYLPFTRGADLRRDYTDKPVHTISTYDFPFAPPLQESQNSNGRSLTTVYQSASRVGGSAQSGSLASGVVYAGAASSGATPAAPAPETIRQHLIWERDYYVHQDFKLLKSMGGYLYDNASVWVSFKTLKMSSPGTWNAIKRQTTGIGGNSFVSVSVSNESLEVFWNATTEPIKSLRTQLVNKRNASFQKLPYGASGNSRTIEFIYAVPGTDLKRIVTKSFNY